MLCFMKLTIFMGYITTKNLMAEFECMSFMLMRLIWTLGTERIDLKIANSSGDNSKLM